MTTINPLPHRWDLGLNKDNTLPKRISNSEASAYLQCERKWLYGYKQNLEPVTTSNALSRGVIGHECLAEYYKVLKDTPGRYEQAEKAAMDCLAPYFASGMDIEMLVGLKGLLERYFVYSRADNWEILAVEESYDINVNEQFGYVMRLDLLIRDRLGEIVLVDHKFLYNMPTQEELDMNAQLPKYIGSLRANGIDCKYGMLNVIRHRQKKGGNTDEETFQRFTIRPTNIEVRNVLKEQFRASQQITALYDDPDPAVLRTMNHMTCKNCSFAPLCKADLLEKDTTDLLLTRYRPNTYGYVDDEAVV